MKHQSRTGPTSLKKSSVKFKNYYKNVTTMKIYYFSKGTHNILIFP